MSGTNVNIGQITVNVNDTIPPDNYATVDAGTKVGTVYTKEQNNAWRKEVEQNTNTGIKGVAKPDDTIVITGFYRMLANTAETFTNYKDVNDSPVVVTVDDLNIISGVQRNEVIIEVNNGVSEKKVFAKVGADGANGTATIPQWVADDYSPNAMVVRDFVQYIAPNGASATDVPGESDKWVKINGNINRIENNVLNNSSLIYASWGAIDARNLIVKIPYVDGAFFDFKVSISNIVDINSREDDNSVKFRFNTLLYYNSVQYFSERLEGNLNIVKTFKLMKDPSGALCLVFTLNELALSVYKLSIYDFSVFSGNINESNYKEYSNITLSNELSIGGYTLVNDFTNDEFEFKNKKIDLVGDSITDGWDNGNIVNTYIDNIKRKFQTPNVVKRAVLGGTIANNPAWNIHILTDATLSAIVADNPDLIILMGGVNDYNVGSIIGDTSSDRTTVIGNLKYSIEYLMSSLPNCKILYCTTGHWFYQPQDMPFVQSGRLPNKVGLTLRNYFDACVELCSQYGIQVLDYNAQCGWLDTNEVAGNYKWTTDGLHFSTLAYNDITDRQLKMIMDKTSNTNAESKDEVFLTQSQYDALSTAQKNNGIKYFIS